MPSTRGPAAHPARRVWLFDLDNTLHDASFAVFGETNRAMNAYIVEHLGVDDREASRLRGHYLDRYGATLLGLVRHHGVDARHFLAETHRHPGLEDRVRCSPHDRAVLKRLSGRRFVLTNAPRDYTLRVLNSLKLADCFDGVISIEDMTMFGHLRPKPDARMFRSVAARLGVRPSDCILVEDMLNNQKAAAGLGMRTVWMQRYLRGRYRGHLAGATAAAVGRPSAAPGPAVSSALIGKVGVHPCPAPAYVHAKIRSFLTLLTL